LNRQDGINLLLLALALSGCSGAPVKETPSSESILGRQSPIVEELVPATEEVKAKDTIAHLVKTQHKSLDLQVLAYYGEKITGQDLLALKSPDARNVTKLNLTGLKLNDIDIEPIAELPLREITLNQTNVEDLHALKNMKTLIVISAEDTKIGTEGLKVLGSLPELTDIAIGRTPLKDEDLESLYKLQKLRVLDLGGCNNISQSAIQAFRQRMPKVVVSQSAAPDLVEKRYFDSLRQIKVSLMSNRSYDDADIALGRLLENWLKQNHPDPAGLASLYELRGACNRELNRASLAVVNFCKSAEFYKKKSVDRPEIPIVNMKLADALELSGDLQPAIKARQQADRFWRNHPHSDALQSHIDLNLRRLSTDLVKLQEKKDKAHR